MKLSDIQFGNIIEKINEGFVALDAKMNYAYINQRGSDLLKRKPEDLIGKNYWDEFPEDKNTPFGQAYLRALETQTHIKLEDYYAPTDRWFENRIYPSPDGLSIFFNDITERKLAEEQLNRTASFNNAVMSNMGEGLYTVDSEGLVTSLNPAAEELFGWTLDELRGRRMHDVTHYKHPDGTPFPAEECAGFQVLHHGQILANYEDVFIRKDGTFFNVVYSSSPLQANGKVNGLVVVFKDITKRKRDEDALRRSEERLRLAIEAAQMFSWEFDIQNQTSIVAHNFAEAVGFSAGLIPNNNEDILQKLIVPKDVQLILAMLTKAIKDHKDIRLMQFRILNPENGQPIWLEVNGKVIYDRDDNPTRMFGVAQNITESKQTEAYIRYLNTELQAQLDEMNTLLKILPTGVWIGNHDCSKITGNPAAYRILGFESGTNVSITNPEPQAPTGLRIFVNGEEVLPENAPMQVVARSGKPWHGFEHELLFPDGTRKAIYGSVVPLFDEQGAVRKVIASYTDFTERKQAEKRLTLLADVSELTRKIEDPNELMYAISKAVGEQLQVRRCLFNEIDLERDLEIVHRDYYNGVESVAGEHKVSDYSSVTSAEVAAGKTVVNNDSKTDVRTAKDYERSYAPQGERAYVAVPMMRENRWVGSLWVSDDVPRHWSKEEVSLLETIAERTWTVIEKLRINTALRESEARYRFIVENTSDGIWHIELTEPMPISLPEEEQLDWYYEHAVIRQCNPGLAHMYGYNSVEEVIGMPMRDIMPRENPVNLELSRKFIRSGYRLVDAESRETSKDGRELVFLNNMVGEIQDGQLKGEWGTNRDITERKRMEDERDQLLEREQAQRASAEQAKIEAEQAWVEAERELAERKLAEAALGEWADAPLPQDKRPAWLRYAVAILVTLMAVMVRVLFNPLLGDALELVTIYGAVAFSVWYGGVGPAILSVLLGYVAITGLLIEPRHVFVLNAQNVTGLALFLFSNTVVMALGETMRRAQRHAHQSARVAVERQHQAETQLREKQIAEQSLRQSEALYRGIARSIPGGGVYVVDKDFRYLVAEGPVTDVFGLSRERLEGHIVSEVFSKEPGERMEARLQRNFAGETVDFETTHNGRVYWTQQAPMLDSLGNVDNAIIMTIDITDRKQMEEALRRSEERFVRFMHHLPGLAWIKDTDGRYVYANAAAEKAFNTPREDLYGRTDEEIFPPEVAAQFRKNDELALMDEKGVQVTETLEQEDGILHYSLVNKFPIPGPDGSTTLIGGTAFDITERRQAEEALRESEEHFRAILRQATAGIVRKDVEGRFIFVNEAFCNMLGYTETELLGKTIWQFTHQGDLEENKRLYDRAMMEGIPFKLEKRLLRKDGSILWVDVSVSPIMDVTGTPQSAVAVEVDITGRKQAEEAVRESKERYLNLFNTVPVAVYTCNADGWIEEFNQQAVELWGREPKKSDPNERYCGSLKIFYPDGRFMPHEKCPMARMLRGETLESYELEILVERPDGSRRNIIPHPRTLKNERGEIVGAINCLYDFTDRKQAEDALHQLNLQLESRVKKRTVELQTANQSLREEITERQKVEDALHESRKRLQILSQRLVDVQEEERRALARELHDSVGQSLSALNINLVILDNQISSRVPQEISVRLDDSVQLVAETINLVRDVMSDLRPPVLDDYGLEAALQSHVDSFKSRYDIDVQFEKPDQLLPRLGSSIEMTFLRIAQEALINVARHARANQINLSLTRDENAVRLIVEDNGTGITSWQQANRPGSHGLTIMRERAEAFGGELEVSSVPGKGTKVEATIPIGVGGQDNIQKERSE